MHLIVIPSKLLHVPEIIRTDATVWAAIHAADRAGEAAIGLAELGRRINMFPCHVLWTVRKLEKLGLVKVTRSGVRVTGVRSLAPRCIGRKEIQRVNRALDASREEEQ